MMTALRLRRGSLRHDAVALVLADRDDDRVLRVVRAHRDLAAQRLAIRAPEVPQRLGAGRADARVLVLVRDDLLGALGLDARQLELLAQDLGELLQRDLDLEQVLARSIAGLLPCARLLFALAERIAALALALPDAALLLVAELEVRDVDLRQRDRDRVLALLRDHLALRDVLAEVLLDLAADDLAEAAVIEIDLLRHDSRTPRPRCRPAR